MAGFITPYTKKTACVVCSYYIKAAGHTTGTAGYTVEQPVMQLDSRLCNGTAGYAMVQPIV